MNFEMIQPLLDWMQSHPALAGLVVFVIASSESLIIVGVVIPGVALMLGVGALVGLGILDFWGTMFWAILGAVAGDGISYWVGRHFDRQLRSIWPFTKHPELLPRGERFFHKHGAISIIIGRFIGPVRPVIPAIAGIMHMNPWVFTIVNVASAIAWAPVVILPGAAVGASMHLASEITGRLVVLFLLLLLLIWGLVLLLRFIDRQIIAPFLRHSSRLGRIDYMHMPGLLLNYLLESTLGVFVITILLGMLLAQFEAPEVTTRFPELSKQQWLDGGWEGFAVTREADEFEPFTIQWWASELSIQKDLVATGWNLSQSLDHRNALLWLSPSLKVKALPFPGQTFRNRKQSLMFVFQDGDEQNIRLLRFWPARGTAGDTLATAQRLWLGTVEHLQIKELWGFRYPIRVRAAQQSDQFIESHLQGIQNRTVESRLQPYRMLLIY